MTKSFSFAGMLGKRQPAVNSCDYVRHPTCNSHTGRMICKPIAKPSTRRNAGLSEIYHRENDKFRQAGYKFRQFSRLAVFDGTGVKVGPC